MAFGYFCGLPVCYDSWQVSGLVPGALNVLRVGAACQVDGTDGGDSGDPYQGGTGTITEQRTRPRTGRPPLFKVIFLNDDYTPMEFVVEVLKTVFHKAHAEATRIMLHVHQNGMAVVGAYPFGIAETRVAIVEELARQHEYPLKCVMDKQ